MCQYLYAAFSLKQTLEEGLTSAQLAVVDCWARSSRTWRPRRCSTWRSSKSCSSASARRPT
jgi:hypothetical protein